MSIASPPRRSGHRPHAVPERWALADPTATEGGGSSRTAVVALLANLGVMLAKGAAAALTGSAALLAEAIHSLADVLNELLLIIGVRRSLRPADAEHPRGYGRERYFWSLLAAVGIFVVGGLFAIADGVEAYLHPREVTHVAIGLAVLALSAGLEGASWVIARRQLRGQAETHSVDPVDLIDVTSDPTPVTVFLEDSAALAGITLAAAGLVLHAVTGSAVWDSAASIAVGLLLIWVAVRLIMLNRRLLVGLAGPESSADHVRERLQERGWVREVTDVVLVYVGPSSVSVSVDVVPHVDLTAVDLVQSVEDARHDLASLPGVASVALTLVARGPAG